MTAIENFQSGAFKKYGLKLPEDYLNLWISNNRDFKFNFNSGEKDSFFNYMSRLDSDFKKRNSTLGKLIKADLFRNKSFFSNYPFVEILNKLCKKDQKFKTFEIINIDFSIYGSIIITTADKDFEINEIEAEIKKSLELFIFEKIESVFEDSYQKLSIKIEKSNNSFKIQRGPKSFKITIDGNNVNIIYGKLKI